jgi:hypothetical protein
MEKSVRKFLEFNGKTIYFLSKDGDYWVAIKPICEALKLEYTRQFKNIKEDDILGQLLAEQPMVGADGRTRKMTSLPEFYIYGWLFSIQSASKDLRKYKWECYRVLYSDSQLAAALNKPVVSGKLREQIEDILWDYKYADELQSVSVDLILAACANSVAAQGVSGSCLKPCSPSDWTGKCKENGCNTD